MHRLLIVFVVLSFVACGTVPAATLVPTSVSATPVVATATATSSPVPTETPPPPTPTPEVWSEKLNGVWRSTDPAATLTVDVAAGTVSMVMAQGEAPSLSRFTVDHEDGKTVYLKASNGPLAVRFLTPDVLQWRADKAKPWTWTRAH